MTIRTLVRHRYTWAFPRPRSETGNGHRRKTFGPAWSWSIGQDVLFSGFSLVCVGATTGVLLAFRGTPLSGLSPIAYLIPIVLAATRWGRIPSIIASLCSVCAADFFFLEPLYSFRIDNPQEAIDLLIFLIVALVSSNLASRLRIETRDLLKRQAELRHLYELSRRLASCFTVNDLIVAVQSYLSRYLQQTAVFLPFRDGRFFEPHDGITPKGLHDFLADLQGGETSLSASYFDELTHDVWLIWDFRTEQTSHGVIAVNLGHEGRKFTNSRISAENALRDASAVLARLDIGNAVVNATAHEQTQSLRDAFIGSLSHELRSPIAAIHGSASVLNSRSDVRRNDDIRHLVQAISDEVSHLDGFIQNILHATRITVGGVAPHINVVDPTDVINSALQLRESRLATHRVLATYASDLPLIEVDAVLVAEAFGQILENAAKYSPAGSAISVSVTSDDSRVTYAVTDQGAGITSNEQKQLGRRAFRSLRHQASIPGSGLGFWIASTFIAANNGTITATSKGLSLGTTVSISFPGLRLTASGANCLDD